MIKKYKGQLILSSIVILLPIAAGLLMWKYLPESMTTHWNMSGEADGFSNKAFAIFVPTLILFFSHWLCVWVTTLDKNNQEQSNKVLGMIFWIMPIDSLLINGAMYSQALGLELSVDAVVRVLLAGMFLLFGNYMPKCKQNSTIGVKVIWTLKNEENWNKTHRFTGRLWVFGGLLCLLTIFVPMRKIVYVFFPFIFIMAFAPMIYSYVYYRKQLKAGTATKEETVLTPSEKKTTGIMTAVGIVILVIAVIFLFTGKFKVTFDETSFTIDAAYWNDVAVNYADIDNIEYREQDDPSASASRTFGYGSINLLMGEFENDEFGAYTRYSYTACDSCVVLTVDEKILVINGTDDEQTKAIYDELIRKMGE